MHRWTLYGWCHFWVFLNNFFYLFLSQTPQESLFKVLYWYWPASGVTWLLGNRSNFRACYECDDKGVRRDRQDCPTQTHTHTPSHTQSDLCVCASLRKRRLEGAISKLLWAAVPLNCTSVGQIDTSSLEQLYLWTTKCPSYLHHIWHVHHQSVKRQWPWRAPALPQRSPEPRLLLLPRHPVSQTNKCWLL